MQTVGDTRADVEIGHIVIGELERFHLESYPCLEFDWQTLP